MEINCHCEKLTKFNKRKRNTWRPVLIPMQENRSCEIVNGSLFQCMYSQICDALSPILFKRSSLHGIQPNSKLPLLPQRAHI